MFWSLPFSLGPRAEATFLVRFVYEPRGPADHVPAFPGLADPNRYLLWLGRAETEWTRVRVVNTGKSVFPTPGWWNSEPLWQIRAPHASKD